MGDTGESPSAGRPVAQEPSEHPLVAQLRENPAEPAEPTVTLTGLFGRSDRAANRRVYFSSQLDHYAEFRAEDVLAYADVAPEQSPVAGQAATRVTLRHDATIEFTHTRTAASPAQDQFDLDVRLGANPVGTTTPPQPIQTGLCRQTCITQCGDTCMTCGPPIPRTI